MSLPFETFDHTADAGLMARGATLPELFTNAALGLMSLLVEPSTVQPGGLRDRVRAEAPDRDALLVNWLNEILFLFSVQKEVFCRFQIRSFSDTAIEAEAEGELFDPGRHGLLREIKAATFHGLKISRTTEGWEARVVFDV